MRASLDFVFISEYYVSLKGTVPRLNIPGHPVIYQKIEHASRTFTYRERWRERMVRRAFLAALHRNAGCNGLTLCLASRRDKDLEEKLATAILLRVQLKCSIRNPASSNGALTPRFHAYTLHRKKLRYLYHAAARESWTIFFPLSPRAQLPVRRNEVLNSTREPSKNYTFSGQRRNTEVLLRSTRNVSLVLVPELATSLCDELAASLLHHNSRSAVNCN